MMERFQPGMHNELGGIIVDTKRGNKIVFVYPDANIACEVATALNKGKKKYKLPLDKLYHYIHFHDTFKG